MIGNMTTEFAAKMLEEKRMNEVNGKLTYFQMISMLKDYMPESRVYTSDAEAKFLKEFFGLEGMSRYELCNLRDMVVMMWDNWLKVDSSWLMSVTVVIDEMINKR